MTPPSTTAELLVSQFAPAVLLTLKQVSQATGQAEQTIRNLISQNRTTLPTRKVGGRRVVHVLDLAAWLDEQRVASDNLPIPIPSRRRPGRPTKAEQRRACSGCLASSASSTGATPTSSSTAARSRTSA